jgi:hypothetical protein
MRPLWVSATWRTMASPSPDPGRPWEVVPQWKRPKICSDSSAGMPGPLSLTVTSPGATVTFAQLQAAIAWSGGVTTHLEIGVQAGSLIGWAPARASSSASPAAAGCSCSRPGRHLSA